MTELFQLEPIPGGNVSNDDLLLIWDAQNERAYKISRAALLDGVARENEDATFASLAAEEITVTTITPALLSFVSGGGIADMVTGTASVAVPTLSASATASVAVPMVGAVAGMLAVVTFTAGLPEGLLYGAYVSAADVVTIRFANVSAGSITGETRAAAIALISLPA